LLFEVFRRFASLALMLSRYEGAKKQLEIGRKSINEIMVNVGHSDTQTFRNIFKRITRDITDKL
jgi:methylphosphotriester-DNA--protein-cysteine methyltransferase